MVKALIGWAVVAVLLFVVTYTLTHRQEILDSLNRPAASMTFGDVLLIVALAVAFLRKH